MIKRALLATVVASCVFAVLASNAFAVANATLYNTSTGATGVKSSTYVLDRTTWAEGYFVSMYSNTHFRSDGNQVGMAAELYQKTGSGAFYPVAHLFYADGDSNYNNDEKILWYNTTVSNDAWHSLSLYQKAVGTSDYWVYQVDGTTVSNSGGIWWPYPTGNRCQTAVEYASGSATSGFPNFLGRHTSVNVRASNGTWYLQTESVFPNRVFWNSAYNVPGYSVYYVSQDYDWQWMK